MTFGSFVLGYVCQVSRNVDTEFIAVASVTGPSHPQTLAFKEIITPWSYLKSLWPKM